MRGRVECLDGLSEGQDLSIHQALVELEQVRPLRTTRLQQVCGEGAERDRAEPCGVQRRSLAEIERDATGAARPRPDDSASPWR